jgi:ankyrin repeat protein
MEAPKLLNPFEILNIAVNASPQDVKNAFRWKICSPTRHERAMYTLAYDMICSKDPTKYTKLGGTVFVNKQDHFYYVITGNYDLFVERITKQKSLLNQRDEYGRTLLYIAARSGFHNICSFLLKSGCNINEIQKDGSTALHAAAFYGQKLIVELLLEYGANPEIKNNFGNNPKDEALNLQIRDCILSKTDDKINTLLNLLKNQGFAKNLVLIKYRDRIIGKKILRNPECFSGYSTSYLTKYWTLAWHGTKYHHLHSIMKYGL